MTCGGERVEHWHQSCLNHGIWHQWISMPVPEDLNREDWTVETSNQTLKLIIPIWFWCEIKLSLAWWHLVMSAMLRPFTNRFFGVYHSLPVFNAIYNHLYIPNFELLRSINGFISTAVLGGCIRPNSSQLHPCVSHASPQPQAASSFKWLELLGDGLVGLLGVFFSRKNTWVMPWCRTVKMVWQDF